VKLEPEIWTAEVVYLGFGTPMLRGGLLVVGEHVAMTGGLEELRHVYPSAPIRSKGKALTPPVVNAHTHLDLSRLPYFQGRYIDFIRHVIAHGSARGVEAARQGLEELQRLGVGAFGDIVARDDVMDWLLGACELPGIAYREVIGPDPSKAGDIFEAIKPRLLAWKKREGRVRVGISPHAPHTVSTPLLQKVAEFARLEGFPVQIHVAESPDEREYLERAEGSFVEFNQQMKIPVWEPPGVSPVQYLADLNVLGPGITLVHGVQVDENDVRIMAQTGCRVVSCPRSNEGLACGELPWALYLKHGVEVALGTDSRGSSPDLDVKNEALYLWSRLDPRLLVRAATRSGYRVLGLETPRITRGTHLSQVQSW